MALNDRSDQVVRAFVRSDLPSDVDISDSFRKYLTGEFDLIQQVLSEANDSAPQVSEAAPSSLRKGMVRYAVAPWDPIGTGFTGYVTYNGAAWVKGTGLTYTAADIANVAAGNIAAVNVQTALNELDSEKLAINHDNKMTAQLGFTQLNSTPAAVEGFQWAPFIYVTTPAAESIGVTGKTKTAGGALTTVMELSDSVYFYDRQFPVYLQWSDAGATAGPALVLQRNSASPAAADQIGEIRFEGRDSTNANTLYAEIIGRIDTPTDTTEQGSIGIYARNGGASTTEEARIGYNGTTHGSPTGGMKGAGTINAANGFYDNGTRLQYGKLLRKTIYNTNAGSPFTWTLQSDVNYVVVECVGGGGGGGAATAGAAASSAYGGGGGAGAYSRKLVARASLGATETVTIAAAAASAANGGTCSFGTHVSSGGGLAGASFALSAAAAVGGALGGGGGTATAGDEQYAGACGATALRLSALAGFNGAGAPSVWGGGGAAIANGNAVGNAGTAPGSGGAGGSGSNTGTARAGGAGAVGQVIVWEYS